MRRLAGPLHPLDCHRMKRLTHFLIATLAALSFGAHAQEATIRKNLAERLPSLPETIG